MEQVTNRPRQSPRQRIPIRLVLEHRRQRVWHRRAGKRDAARHHLVQHAAKRPEVGSLVDHRASHLFRAHVRCRAEQRAVARAANRHGRRLSQIGCGIVGVELRQAEVEDFDDPPDVILMLAGFRSRWTIPFS